MTVLRRCRGIDWSARCVVYDRFYDVTSTPRPQIPMPHLHQLYSVHRFPMFHKPHLLLVLHMHHLLLVLHMPHLLLVIHKHHLLPMLHRPHLLLLLFYKPHMLLLFHRHHLLRVIFPMFSPPPLLWHLLLELVTVARNICGRGIARDDPICGCLFFCIV